MTLDERDRGLHLGLAREAAAPGMRLAVGQLSWVSIEVVVAPRSRS